MTAGRVDDWVAPIHAPSVASTLDIYRGARPEDVPAYSLAEAASLVSMSPSTLRSWVRGRWFPSSSGNRRFEALIRAPRPSAGFLSFTNLVEAHVLSAMRKKHALRLGTVRQAIRYVERELGVSHPLATEKFKTDGVDLFVERLGRLIIASQHGQLAMRDVLGASLERVEYDDQGRAVRLFPFFGRAEAPKHIVIDPRRAFGRPVLLGTSIPVSDIAARFSAGEDVDDLAADYDVSSQMIQEALRAARPAA